MRDQGRERQMIVSKCVLCVKRLTDRAIELLVQLKYTRQGEEGGGKSYCRQSKCQLITLSQI